MLYTLQEIYLIKASMKSSSEDYISTEVKNTISDLNNIICKSSYKLKPNFNTKLKTAPRSTIKPANIINNIRLNMNKLSVKNYDRQYEKIKCSLSKLKSDAKERGECAIMLFELASENLFFSELYADLYYKLYMELDFLREPLNNSLSTFISSYQNIENMSQAENYDMFCSIIKNNTKRIALLTFIIYLMKLNTLRGEGICGRGDVIMELSLYLVKNIDGLLSTNKSDQIEQLAENLLVIIRLNGLHVLSRADGRIVQDHIDKISNARPNDFEGLTFKTIFKYKDMKDIIKKDKKKIL